MSMACRAVQGASTRRTLADDAPGLAVGLCACSADCCTAVMALLTANMLLSCRADAQLRRWPAAAGCAAAEGCG